MIRSEGCAAWVAVGSTYLAHHHSYLGSCDPSRRSPSTQMPCDEQHGSQHRVVHRAVCDMMKHCLTCMACVLICV